MRWPEVICDDQIMTAFHNTSFGKRDHRKLLEQGVLKIQAGFRTGHTLGEVMGELGLLTPKGRVSRKGSRFIYFAFKDSKNSG